MLVQYLKGTLDILANYRISEATMAWFKKKHFFFLSMAKPDDYSYCILYSISNPSILFITIKKKKLEQNSLVNNSHLNSNISTSQGTYNVSPSLNTSRSLK